MSRRGIIIIPEVKTNNAGAALEWSQIDPAYLRKCLVYWDTIEIPEGIIGGPLPVFESTELALLEDAGILKRTTGHLIKRVGDDYHLSFPGEHPREFLSLAQTYLLNKRQLSGERWALSQVGPTLILPDPNTDFLFVEPMEVPGIMSMGKLPALAVPHLEHGPVLQMQFQQALVTPSANEPLDKVLKFRERFQFERDNLWYALDELYLEAMKCPEDLRAFAILHKVDEVDKILRSINEIMQRTFRERLWANFTAEWDLGKALTLVLGGIGGVTGSGMNMAFDLPAVMGSLVGVTATLGLKIVLSELKPVIPKANKDFAYLYHVQKELSPKLPK